MSYVVRLENSLLYILFIRSRLIVSLLFFDLSLSDWYISNSVSAICKNFRLVFIIYLYYKSILSERTCREWFQRFKNDFDIED